METKIYYKELQDTVKVLSKLQFLGVDAFFDFEKESISNTMNLIQEQIDNMETFHNGVLTEEDL